MHGPFGRVVLCALFGVLLAGPPPAAGQSAAAAEPGGRGAASSEGTGLLEEAQRLFYAGRFADAGERARLRTVESPRDLAAFEVRTSALHFQIRRAMGSGKDRKAALRACGTCPELLEVFFSEITRGTAAARARLADAPEDVEAKYYLAKIDLTYLWMQLSTLGRRTGWDQYWEAKRLIESVLATNPAHVRARVAHAWIEYIVSTRVPWGARWVMGGGNKNRALEAVREAVAQPADYYAEVEAKFALWEMLAREGRRAEAVPVAQGLLAQFPENEELAKFVSGS